MSKSKEQKVKDARNKKRREQRANKLETPKTAAQNKKNIEILKKRATKVIKKNSKSAAVTSFSKPDFISTFTGLTAKTDLHTEVPNTEVKILSPSDHVEVSIPLGEVKLIPNISVDGLQVKLEDNVTINFSDKDNEPVHNPPVEFVTSSKGILRDFKAKFTSLGQLVQDIYHIAAAKFFLWKIKFLKSKITFKNY